MSQLGAGAEGARGCLRENMHLTVRFIGHVDDESGAAP